jgi:hypothetical protein
VDNNITQDKKNNNLISLDIRRTVAKAKAKAKANIFN